MPFSKWFSFFAIPRWDRWEDGLPLRDFNLKILHCINGRTWWVGVSYQFRNERGSQIELFTNPLSCSMAPDVCWQSSKTIKYLNRHETRFSFLFPFSSFWLCATRKRKDFSLQSTIHLHKNISFRKYLFKKKLLVLQKERKMNPITLLVFDFFSFFGRKTKRSMGISCVLVSFEYVREFW